MYYGMMMMMMINCLCGMVFPLSGFSFMDIQDSQDSRGMERLSL